jgi:hypothetical protein
MCDNGIDLGDEALHREDGFAEGSNDCVACLNGIGVGFVGGIDIKVSYAVEDANNILSSVIAVTTQDGDIVLKMNEIPEWV